MEIYRNVIEMENKQTIFIPYMPSGKPCPIVLTSEEAIELLRLEGKTERTLKYYRDIGLLNGIRLGRKIRYRLTDVLEFLHKKAEKTNRSMENKQ
jgi:hypothetical protein